jgi:TonB-linked SusC/RagA family outer membrane protein
MHHALGAFAMMLVVTGAVAAQDPTGSISGRVVRAETGEPVNGAQVFVVGTQLGILTNAEGRFLIPNVPVGNRTVRIQMMGFSVEDQTVTVAAGQTATVSFTVREQAVQIAPLVVTALGIQRSEKSLGYAVQSVTAQTLDRSPEVTLVNALAGQTAGVQVVSSSGRPGASSRITIRGESSFAGGGQPLFVIDGVPVSIDLDNRGGNPLEFGEAGNRGMDFDPNNIEEISVLRGAAATALYGSRAAAGAVIIRTKQGQPGSPLRFSLSSNMRMDRPILGGYITDWAAGLDGYFCNGKLEEQGGWCMPGYPSNNPSPTTGNNWGPHKDSIPQMVLDSSGPVRFRDAREDFYQTARVLENSLNATGSMGTAGHYNFTASHLNQQGIVQAAKLERLNLGANVTLNLHSRLRSNTVVQYANTNNDWQIEGYQSLTRTLINLPPTRDIRQAWNADGTPVMWGGNTPHPEWIAENEYNGYKTKRWIASQYFDLTILPGVNLTNRIGLDTYVDERQQYANERPWRTAAGLPSGSTDQEKITSTQINNDLQLMFQSRQITDMITVSGLIGGNIFMREYNSRLRGIGQDLNVPGFYNISNFATQRVNGTLANQRRIVGVYSQATVDYSNWAFLTLTGRNDWSSTLPTEGNNYFYPSASLGIVFTDALGLQSRFLDYGKLRLSIAKVGSDAPPYRLSTRYVTAQGAGANIGIQQFGGPSLQFPFGGQNAFIQSTSLGNPVLKPESTREIEAGLELRLLESKVRLDISYYNKSSYDQIFNVPSSAATGFTQITRNAGDLKNSGFEVSLETTPVRTRDMLWNVRANWSKNKSEVLSLAPGVTSIYLAGYSWPQIRIMEGEEYGVIWGYGWRRNEQGQMLIGDNGLPILSTDLGVIGRTQPDWTGNLSTSFNWKGIGVSGLLDVRKGGEILNFETQYTVNSGRSILTQERGTYTTLEGVNVNTGQPNTVQVIKNRAFYNYMHGFDKHEGQIEPGGFVKLREVTASYRIPETLVQRLGVQSMSLYLSGRNLKTWSDFSQGDPEGDNYGGANAGGQYFRFFPAPQTRSFVLGLRASF